MTPTASVNERIQLAVKGAVGSTCDTELAKGPWEFDKGVADYGPGASSEDHIPLGAPIQAQIPAEYRAASDEELHDRIRAAKAPWAMTW